MARKLILLMAGLLVASAVVRAQNPEGSALFKEMQRENQQLRTQLQENRELLQKSRTTAENLRTEISDFEARINKLQNELRESRREKASMAEDLNLLREAREKMTAAYEAQKARSDKLEEIVVELRSLVRKQAGAVQSQKQQLTTLRENQFESGEDPVEERVNLHYNLAVLYDRNQLYQRAEKHYLRCLELSPEDVAVHYNLGILYEEKLDRPRKALEHYRSFLNLNPSGEDARRVERWIKQLQRKL